MTEFLHHYKEIMLNPPHLAAELSLMLLVDVFFLGLIWPLVRRRVRKVVRREHLLIDKEHGVINHGKDELTDAGRRLRAFAEANLMEHDVHDSMMRVNVGTPENPQWVAPDVTARYVPCALEHEPGRLCVLPIDHPPIKERSNAR